MQNFWKNKKFVELCQEYLMDRPRVSKLQISSFWHAMLLRLRATDNFHKRLVRSGLPSRCRGLKEPAKNIPQSVSANGSFLCKAKNEFVENLEQLFGGVKAPSTRLWTKNSTKKTKQQKPPPRKMEMEL